MVTRMKMRQKLSWINHSTEDQQQDAADDRRSDILKAMSFFPIFFATKISGTRSCHNTFLRTTLSIDCFGPFLYVTFKDTLKYSPITSVFTSKIQ